MTVINRNSGSPVYDTIALALLGNMRIGQICIVKNNITTDGITIDYEIKASGSGGLAMANGNELVALTSASIDSVADLFGLAGSVDGQQLSVGEYHVSSRAGGGVFAWSLSGRHDGGNFIDTSRAFPTDWTDESQKTAWYADSGSNTAGFRRVDRNGTFDEFGAWLDGSNDDTKACNKMLSVVKDTELPEGRILLSSELIPQSESSIKGRSRASVIFVKDGDTNGFNLSGLNGVKISGITFRCKTLAGTLGGTNGKAAIYLSNSTDCTISDNYIFDMYNAGVRLFDSSDNTIKNNYFGDWFTTATRNDDCGNILCLASSSFNLIDGNYCIGEFGGHGVAISDYTIVGKQALGNIVTNNHIANKRAYGILHYTTDVAQPNSVDTRTIITNNVINTIYGDYIGVTPGIGNSGAGIYMQGGDGTVCSSNTLYDCNKLTAVFGTLAMAAIAVNITNESEASHIIVSDNNVHTFSGPGIWATSSTTRGIKVRGNNVRVRKLTSGDDSGIILSACSDSEVFDNTVRHEGPGSAIYINTSGRDCERLNISNNNVRSVNAAGSGIVFEQVSGAFLMKEVICNNNTIVSQAGRGISASFINGLTLLSNKVDASTTPYNQSNCTRVKSDFNYFKTAMASGYSINIGAAVDSWHGKNNEYDLGTSKILHSGVDNQVIEQVTNGAVPPIFGTYQVGDRVENAGGVIGSPKGWVCTVAGEPGTFTSIGNL